MNTTDQSQWAPPQSAYERAREAERQQVIAEYQAINHWAPTTAGTGKPYGTLRFVSMTVIVFGWMILVAGFLSGVGLIAYVDDNNKYSFFSFGDRHPYLGGGIATMVGSLFYASFVLLFGYWAHSWARSKAA